MTLMQVGIIAVCAYLLGSLSFAIIVSKATMGQDIRDFGSGNAGLTNSYRVMGAGKTLFVLLGDIAKGAAAVSIGALVAGGANAPLGKLIAGVFVILGHMFPLYFGLRGGKGVLVGAVMLALFDYRIFFIAFILFIIAVTITKWVSLGSILAAVSCPITTFVFYRDPVLTAMIFGMALGVIFMHRSNIARIVKGEENKFSFKRKKEQEPETLVGGESMPVGDSVLEPVTREPAQEMASDAEQEQPETVQAEEEASDPAEKTTD